MADHIGYGHVEYLLTKASPAITNLPFGMKHHLALKIIELINSYAEPEAATGKGE